MGISKLDTVKDKDGKRFRVAEVQTVDGQIIAVLKGIHADGSPRRGGARNVRADVLERDYTRVDLPPVTIKKIDDLREEKKQMVKEPTPSERASQIEAQAVRELSSKDVDELQRELNIAHMDLETMENEVADLRKTISKMHQEHDAEVQELNDHIMELEILAKKKNEYADALDEDAIAFENMHKVARAIVGMADSIGDLAYMIQNETEARS